ncbi:AMP-binding protein [Noviherbaspirillum suwonense]|uniref:4-coumarate--CoA ligase, photoactive yellow protein activation family n=1 Tax=Noviherbaspirillum suwonense TaxID=1224511 RepID=A0ABY1QQP6_9BURK|nr:AMP-binding protein [Noviherbaspirillum suwonense]SMP74979.1 4-coumarate--CoA ligase, photoactive yellow protein activation family [Noviherbaspirillum suwonense]
MPVASDNAGAGAAWWDDEAGMQRFVADLVAGELAAMRLTGPALPPRPWPADLHIGRDLGADSLELMGVASALADALQMHESGIEDYLLVRLTLGEWTQIAQTSLSRFSHRLTFRTSGSTGIPKSCVHELDALLQEVREIAPLLQGTRRILSAVPSHHIYGFLFTMLLPAALGLAAGDVIDLRSGSAASLGQQLRQGDLVIGHPEFWRAAVRAVRVFPDGVTGATSTAPCPDEISEALQQAGLARLLQVYGSSETAGIGWRFDHEAPYQLLSFWRRAGVDGAGLLRDGDDAVRQCQDRLTWLDERRFVPTGRIDQAVQVGGMNVFPARVRRELLLHPDVLDASVRLMRPAEGNRLKAFVVPRDAAADPAELHAKLDAWAGARLTAPERPRAFSFGAALPVDAKGKPADWLIRG